MGDVNVGGKATLAKATLCKMPVLAALTRLPRFNGLAKIRPKTKNIVPLIVDDACSKKTNQNLA